ncbi:hypothetical protein GUITHDRAFT_150184 [Guillardia theta CCMP2712]|uniref:Uncharacterized protein n=1 Tax=Guillardia theta (strain CCMP2712) TaxID=905079 RepID=L1K021_GUITC|nr:hypothetical protein GUITHDRAFT_150184 [Guillardia theta CCMP2712]EKX54206.1 hypothetical protein GUITHDRAFT_150184 [Guillardia theta CCMP2712]|eukprot:XP_005841186.1 hypothetical protein GUITHDRAFT_150184 [Guillardia theta CCMP2712]
MRVFDDNDARKQQGACHVAGNNEAHDEDLQRYGRVSGCEEQASSQQDESDHGKAMLESPAVNITPKGSWRRMEELRNRAGSMSESSDEDTCDEEYLRRHLPYERSEQHASVRVYADDSCTSCSFLAEAESILDSSCSFIQSSPAAKLEGSFNGADVLEDELRDSHRIRGANELLASSC